jgi:hypothetical protein
VSFGRLSELLLQRPASGFQVPKIHVLRVQNVGGSDVERATIGRPSAREAETRAAGRAQDRHRKPVVAQIEGVDRPPLSQRFADSERPDPSKHRNRRGREGLFT